MLIKLYNKSKIGFSIACIIAYCVLLSLGDNLSVLIGIEKLATLPLALLLTAAITVFLWKNSLFAEYGLCKRKTPLRSVAFYLPLLLLLSANLWFGVRMNLGALETVLYIASMLLVGFLEEVIFRGLLFGAMREETPRAAIIVSSVTFGIGHIINLINGSGAELIPNVLQVVYATAAGFMFVMLYLKTKSLIPCIITHGLFNSLSVFSCDAPDMRWRIVSCVAITVISAAYAAYIAVSLKNDNRKSENSGADGL